MNLSLRNNSPTNKKYNTELETNFLSTLSKLRIKNAHININSILNKFHLLTSNLSGKIDILMISETKLDNSLPKSEFILPGLYRTLQNGQKFSWWWNTALYKK